MFDDFPQVTFIYISSGSWSSRSNNLNQWIQAEFTMPCKITAIQIQGRGRHNQWVKSFKLSYGNDGVNWSDVDDKDGEELVKINIFPYRHRN